MIYYDYDYNTSTLEFITLQLGNVKSMKTNDIRYTYANSFERKYKYFCYMLGIIRSVINIARLDD